VRELNGSKVVTPERQRAIEHKLRLIISKLDQR
jgi:hypothetical protein